MSWNTLENGLAIHREGDDFRRNWAIRNGQTTLDISTGHPVRALEKQLGSGVQWRSPPWRCTLEIIHT